MNPRLSIIISTWNCSQHIQNCVKSIESIPLPSYEILIIDSGSTDGTEQISDSLARYSSGRIRFFSRGRRLTWSEANQIGLDESRGEWICLSNPDILFNDGFSDMLAECEREGLKAAAPQLVYPNGEYQYASKVVTPELFLWLHAPMIRMIFRRKHPTKYDYDITKDRVAAPFPKGSLFLIHRSVLSQMNGRLWHEGYLNGVSDLDAFLNMRENGITMWIFPLIKIVHYESYVTKKIGSGWIERDSAGGFLIYFRRHHLSNKISPRLYTLIFGLESIAVTAFVLIAHTFKPNSPAFARRQRAWLSGQRILGLIDGWRYHIDGGDSS